MKEAAKSKKEAASKYSDDRTKLKELAQGRVDR